MRRISSKGHTLDRMEGLLRAGATLLLALALIAGCVMPAPSPEAVTTPTERPTTMQGQVELSAFGRETQATLGQIALGATVTLYDPTTNQAIASTVTNAGGAFSLTIPGFTPGAAPYVLEALKGLNSNLANHNAARLRTIVRYSGGTWSSITTPGILLGRSSTALCLIAGLRSALPSAQQIDLATLIGKVTTGTPDTFSAVTNCSVSDYNAVLPLIDTVIALDRDPLNGVALDSTSGVFRLSGHPAIASTTSLVGLMEGASVTLTGTGFDPTPANNTVRFNGAPGVVTSASPTQLVVSMRGLTGGSLTVQVGSLVYQGPSYTVAPFAINDGTTSVSVDNAYQYSPVTAGAGYLHANWTPNPAATGYMLKVGSAPGEDDVLANFSAGTATTYTADGLSLQGAWASASYFVTVTPAFATGSGTQVTSNGVQVAEKAFWDGASTTGLRNDSQGGYSADFPAGSGKTSFFGQHYFETISIANGTTTYVQPFGKQDGIGEAASMNDVRVRTPKDGWLALYANTMTLNGTLDAAGRGYGGGPGTSASGSVYCGHGGTGGLSGSGGWSGGQGRGAAGGGGALNALGAAGGAGGYFGGAGGGGADADGAPAATGSAGNDATTAGGGAGANGNYGGCTAGTTVTGGIAPYGGGIGYALDNTGGTGGAGYGAGGGGAGGSKGLGGGGAGGTGGGMVGSATTGLGWAPGSLAFAYNSAGGPAGNYKPSVDTTTDQSWVLGSGGAGGNAGHNPALTIEYTAGGGGGAGGGALLLHANTLTIGATGRLLAVGAAGGSGGANNSPGSGGGGGGSGGTIVLWAATLTNLGTLDARGGLNGTAGSTVVVSCSGYTGGNGGNGSASSTTGGTIKVFYRSFAGAMPTTAKAGRVYDATI